MRLITPKRLKENEAFLWAFADQTIDEFIDAGECELIQDYAMPFTLMVVADLLGVPDDDRDEFRAHLATRCAPTRMEHKPLEFLYEQFTRYIEDRRANPRDDVMTEMAHATFPDGTLPPVEDVMRIAANLFSAGGETTARLITSRCGSSATAPTSSSGCATTPASIAPFIEEMLRLETPLKGSFKLAKVRTTVGGVDLAPGHDRVRDERRREPRPAPVRGPGRVPARPGQRAPAPRRSATASTRCAGAPLARAETHATIARFLDRTSDIRISEAHHGPPDARRYDVRPHLHDARRHASSTSS